MWSRACPPHYASWQWVFPRLEEELAQQEPFAAEPFSLWGAESLGAPRGVWGELGAKGVNQKGDSDTEDIIPVTGAPFPSCPRQVPKSMELAHGLARAPGRGDRSAWDTEQSLGANEPSPEAVGRGSSRPA